LGGFESGAAGQTSVGHQVLRAARAEAEDNETAARSAQRTGRLLERSGGLEAALESYEDALELSRAANAPQLESELLSDVGLVQAMLGRIERALIHCEKALALAQRINSVRAEAKALICLGDVEYHRGNRVATLEFYERSEALWGEIGDREGLAQTLLLQGYCHSDMSELEEARSHFHEALDLWQGLGDRYGEAVTLVALGQLAYRLGEYQDSLDLYNRALPLLERMGVRIWQASALAGMGWVYSRMGETVNAGVYWERSLGLYREVGLRQAEGELLDFLGRNALAIGDHALALSRFEQVVAISRELDVPRDEAYGLWLIGLVHQARDDPETAIEYFERSLDLQSTFVDPRLEADTRADAGRAHLALGQAQKAEESLSRALELHRSAGDRRNESATLYSLAETDRSREDLSGAREHLESALEIAESVRGRVGSHDLRARYLASVHQYYELYIEVLMRLAERESDDELITQALETAERARAQSLLEGLVEAGVDRYRGVDPQLLERERQLAQALDVAADELMRLMSAEESPGALDAVREEVRDLSVRYDQVQAQIRSQSPQVAELRQPRALDVERIRSQVLDDETLLLEYALGETVSFLWVVSSDGATGFELPARQQIEQATHRVYELLTARIEMPGETLAESRRRVRAADAALWSEATALSETLLGPVAGILGDKRLAIVADGALQYLPFGMLPVPGTGEAPVPLALEHEIVSLPSASTLAVLRRETAGRPTPGGTVAVLADPVFERDDPRLADGERPATSGEAASPENGAGSGTLRQAGFLHDGRLYIPRLVGTRREAAAIVATAPDGSSLEAIGFAASRPLTVSSNLSNYRIVHFATHGLVNTETPGLSAIMLSMFDDEGRPIDGFLRLNDIYQLKLPVDLVVLSACNTALGQELRGEGLVGIVRGFMYAGARRVVASLWKVDDDATGELMGRFYRQMLGEGLAPAAALRQAQIEMWQESDFRSPFYWAAFVLQGEWR
jgi:CHAT domain-containing protein